MKKLKPYLITSGIILAVLSLIFIVKGIFPFGKQSLIWGDMHDQITAFYYHFYDFIYNKGSLLYDFRIGGGISFIGILAYYIISPFTLLVLLVPRDYIYLMVSVIIACKIITCGVTCLYFIRTFFKKVPNMISVMLAILYAFSGYGLVMYQITPWIDSMYMLPLILVGLKKVLDLEKPTFYIICLTLSLIFSFYTTAMSVLFIFFASIFYLINYKDKIERKKSATALGLSTVLSIIISSFIVIPAYMQINESSRIGFKLTTLLNSRLGPITDKIGLLLFGGLIYVAILLLLKDFKKHKQFLKFYLPVLLIVTIPFIIEPINKVWHFGSYAFFPCRFGYITILMLIMGAAYYFNNTVEFGKKEFKNSKIVSIISTVVGSGIILAIAYKFRDQFQTTIHKLSLSYNSKLVILLMIMVLVVMLVVYIILKSNKKINKLSIVLIMTISLVHIISTTYLYLGMHKYNPKLSKEYEILLAENKDNKNDIYRVKSIIYPDNTITNSGLINNYSNIDEFSSLTNKNALETYKKLGFGSQWVLTYSRGSTLFMDAILGNKYISSDKNEDIDFYTLTNTYKDIYFYTNKNNISFGFFINNNDTIFDKENSFEIANSLYKNILNTDDKLFVISTDFTLNNIEYIERNNGFMKYSVSNKEKEAYFEKTLSVSGKQNLYIEIPHTLSNYDNENLNEVFDLYVNNDLVCKDCFTEPENGTYNLGIFEDETVNVKLVLKDTTLFKKIYLGQMDINKYLEFLDKYYINTNITYNRNKMNINVTSDKEQILFIPINYNKNFKAYNNSKEVEIIKMYDNFVGIKVNNGNNDITIKYTDTSVLKLGIISFITLGLTILIIKTNFYNKIINNEIIGKVSYFIYSGLNLAMILMIYVLLILVFLVSFIKYIKI